MPFHLSLVPTKLLYTPSDAGKVDSFQNVLFEACVPDAAALSVLLAIIRFTL